MEHEHVRVRRRFSLLPAYRITASRRVKRGNMYWYCTDVSPVFDNYYQVPNTDYVAAMYLAIKHNFWYWRKNAVGHAN